MAVISFSLASSADRSSSGKASWVVPWAETPTPLPVATSQSTYGLSYV